MADVPSSSGASDPSSGFASAWPQIERVEGWLAREEAQALHEAARAVPAGRWIVEIGSYHGRSTTALVTGKRPDVPVLAIDPYSGPFSSAMHAFCRNMDAIAASPEVQLFRGTSDRAAELRAEVFGRAAERAAATGEPPGDAGRRVFDADEAAGAAPATAPEIGLLFVDGLHDRESVERDMARWEPLVAEGGVVAFHDAFFRRGVTEALLRRHLLNREFRYVGSVVNTSIFRRESGIRTPAAIVDGVRLAGRCGHLARNLVTTVGVYMDWRWLQRLFPPLPDFEYRTRPPRGSARD